MKRHPSSSFDEGFHLERRALTPRGSPTKNHHPVPLKRGRRKREEEEEREAGGGGGGARSIICSTFDERGEGGSKIEGRIVKPSPLPNGQTSRLSGNPAVYGFHKRGPSRERASYGSKIRDRLSVRRLCAPLTLFRG